jgi:hypothetical protein
VLEAFKARPQPDERRARLLRLHAGERRHRLGGTER